MIPALALAATVLLTAPAHPDDMMPSLIRGIYLCESPTHGTLVFYSASPESHAWRTGPDSYELEFRDMLTGNRVILNSETDSFLCRRVQGRTSDVVMV